MCVQPPGKDKSWTRIKVWNGSFDKNLSWQMAELPIKLSTFLPGKLEDLLELDLFNGLCPRCRQSKVKWHQAADVKHVHHQSLFHVGSELNPRLPSPTIYRGWRYNPFLLRAAKVLIWIYIQPSTRYVSEECGFAFLIHGEVWNVRKTVERDAEEFIPWLASYRFSWLV